MKSGQGVMALNPKPQRRRVFLSRRFPPAVEQRIAERYEITRNPDDTILPESELAQAAHGCDYIFMSAMENMTRNVFAALSGTLKAVGTLSSGVNHIDLEAAREFGVAVFYSPGVLSESCAELALLLILNAARRGYEADRLVRSGEWKGYAPTQMLGYDLANRRAGILGMGRIGSAIARRLIALGAKVHYHNRHRLPPDREMGATFHESAEDLLRVSDYLLLCAPGATGFEGFLNRERIAMLPANAIVINLSRGDTVDDDALIESLRSGRVFAAGLDVFAREPHVDPRYRDLPNVFLTPHIGSATYETRNAMGFLILDGFEAFEKGVRAENQLC